MTALKGPGPVRRIVEMNEVRNLIWTQAGDARCRIRAPSAYVASETIQPLKQHSSDI